ncbi:MAG: diacylglycerol kinase [Verrucomicrobiota bacterium]|jgi:diacylglycerol kinase (ATP)
MAARVKSCIILNPMSGRAKNIERLRRKFRENGLTNLLVTRKRGAAEKFAQRAIAEGYDRIIVAGGDGTLNEIVNGIANHSSKVSIGIIPLGTGNDFARSLELPNDLDAAIQVARDGRRKPVDLVRVTSKRVRYFVNVSAGGFSGLVNEKMTPQMKRTWGPLSYLRGAAAAASGLRAYETTIKIGRSKTSSRSLYNVIIGNGRYVAGGIPVAPSAELSDGLLDIILIPELPAGEIAFLGAQILMGKHLSNDSVIFKRAKKVMIKSSPGMWFNVDGELVGNQPAVFEIIPRALHFMVGRK